MSKLIVKSKSFAFGGLYFRAAKPNSIEWTSFEMAAHYFDNFEAAEIKMNQCGIRDFSIEVAPVPPERKR